MNKGLFKVVLCHCTRIIYSAVMPFAENDKDMIRTIEDYEEKGYKAQFRTNENLDTDSFGCICRELDSKQLSLLKEE